MENFVVSGAGIISPQISNADVPLGEILRVNGPPGGGDSLPSDRQLAIGNRQ